jgi:hypothetical protein
VKLQKICNVKKAGEPKASRLFLSAFPCGVFDRFRAVA